MLNMPDDAKQLELAADRAARHAQIADHTPLMRQWLTFKNELGPELIMFFRVGDFYELFWEDAERASKLLDLTLTKRGSSGGREIKMSGVPWHALDLHLSRLLRMGQGAAVIDQISEPGLTKGPVDRAISRVITSGTLLDDSLLEEKRDAPLLAVHQDFKRGGAGLFWMSLSSGAAFHCEVPLHELANEVARIQPAEILISEQASLDDAPAKASFSRLAAWRFDAAGGRARLQEHFGVLNLGGFGSLDDSDLALAAACAAYSHAQASLGNRRPNLLTLQESAPDTRLAMDAPTRRALEITETQSGMSSPTLFSSLDSCASAMGSRRLRLWLSEPPASVSESTGRHEAVAAFLEADDARSDLRAIIGDMADIERASARAAAGLARPRDFSNLREALRAFGSICESLAPLAPSSPKIQRLMTGLGEQPETLSYLERAIAELPSVHIRDGGVIRGEFDATLDELRQLSVDSSSAVQALEAKEREATGIATLRIDFNRAHGFQIEIPRSQAARAPDRYERKQTLKNAERYTMPELAELETKVLGAQEGALKLEKSLFEQAQAFLASKAHELAAAARCVSELDALLNFAEISRERNYCRPRFTEDGSWNLVAARHPVVELLGQEPFVPNDLSMDDDRQTLLITGPNMGGKSTYMRTTALVGLMSRAGCFAPADVCELPPITRICARVGSGDDIARGRSTFMVEMTEAASILRHADANTLCLIDEIGRGTSTYDGMALAWAILRHLTEINGGKTLFSTHYLELSELAESLKGVANIHLDAEQGPQGIVFLRKIKPGAASQSHGIEVARLAGLPLDALAWAQELLVSLHGKDAPKLSEALAHGHAPQSPLAAVVAQGLREGRGVEIRETHAQALSIEPSAAPNIDALDSASAPTPASAATQAPADDSRAAEQPACLSSAEPSEALAVRIDELDIEIQPQERQASRGPQPEPALAAQTPASAHPAHSVHSASEPSFERFALGAALEEAVDSIDPDELTPKMALDKLYELRKLIRAARKG